MIRWVLILIVLAIPAVSSGAVLFETKFDDIPDWNTTAPPNLSDPRNQECGYPCATAPTGFSATRLVPGSAEFQHPTGSIQRLPGNLADRASGDAIGSAGSGTGKAYVIYNESDSDLNWPGDSLLDKIFTSDYNELYVRVWVRTQSGFQWAASGVSGIKMVRVMHYDRTNPETYNFFSAGSVNPAYIWDGYYSTVYGVRMSNSYRCSPQSTAYYCPNSPGEDGGNPSNPDDDLWQNAVAPPGGTTWQSSGMIADTKWHKLDLHVKLNSAPGVNDGVLEWWWDVADPQNDTPTSTTNPQTGVIIKSYGGFKMSFHRTNIQWMSSTSDTSRGWNRVGIGGNSANSFSGATAGEQWLAMDDLVISSTAIPANYEIGGHTNTTSKIGGGTVSGTIQ